MQSGMPNESLARPRVPKSGEGAAIINWENTVLIQLMVIESSLQAYLGHLNLMK